MKFVSKTFHGLEDVLAEELEKIGAEKIEKLHRAVAFEGDLALMYRANLSLRTALNVLYPILEFEVESQDQYFEKLVEFEWDKYFPGRRTFAINAVSNSEIFGHEHFLSLRTKDAVADYFKKRYGRRPNVDKDNPQIKINVHLHDNHCSISLDSSGQPLFKRGYRKFHGDASLNESLAAGLILMSGWDGTTELVDPFCGTGTILIEAALIAANIRPGTYRDTFAFEYWTQFDRKAYQEVLDEDDQHKIEVPILGVDISTQQIAAANANINSAFMQKNISVQKGDFSSVEGEGERGLIVTNPPYDKRVKVDEIQELYRRFGDHIKQNFTEYDAWIISGNMDALRHIGLKTSKRIELFNGPIESRFCQYKLY